MTYPPASGLILDLRRQDRERFITTLFAPLPQREDLMVLYAFNAEVARIKSMVREPLAGAIRLQWWYDVVTQERPSAEIGRHPVAGPLAGLIAAGKLSPTRLLRLVEARENDLNNTPFATLAEMLTYTDATAGTLAVSALELLGVTDESSQFAARGAAMAYGLMGLVRSIPAHQSQGWTTIPLDLLTEANVTDQPFTPKSDLSLPLQRITEHAQSLVHKARSTPFDRKALCVCLLGTLAAGHAKKLKKTKWNPFDSRLAKPDPMPFWLLIKSLMGRF